MSMSDYLKPLPTITDETAPFWAGLNQGELRFQRCCGCGKRRYPISQVCPRCLSADFAWEPVSGRGRVFSFAVFHRAYHPSFAADVPYNVALIRLAEEIFMFSNVVGIANEDIICDMPVMVDFERVTETITLPRFRPVRTP
jgi:uncharacterized OB-fold protein